jgi:2-polyprenyl-6-methoxyphenol hydroxylase-like FAD-dependent oxidoreductase
VSTAGRADRRAAVIGGGIAGLAAARVLSDRGIPVALLERDAEPAVTSPELAFSEWKRSGAPQVRHSHAFLGRLRCLLRDRYPDLLESLRAVGAADLDMLAHPPLTLPRLTHETGDEDLVALGCRRTTFEWVVRRNVLTRPCVELVSGADVRGLLAASGTPPVVTGIHYATRDGANATLDADLVVDASGRHSKAPEWLDAIGAALPRERQEPSGIVYYTRFYRLRPGAAEPPPSAHPAAADYTWIKYAIFPADDRTFSITFAVPLAVPRLKVLARPAAFEAMASILPALAPWIDSERSEPLEDPHRPVQAMGGLINRVRRFTRNGQPVAIGFFAIGDAAFCTNPLYGRGCAQAFLHADLLGAALDAHPDDLSAAAMALAEQARLQIEPFYRASVVADRDAVRRAEGRRPKRLGDRLRQRFFEDGVLPATRCDPVVFRAFLRMFNMIESPERAFGSARVFLRSLRVLARGRRYNRRYAIPDPPDRELTIARCEAAARDAA